MNEQALKNRKIINHARNALALGWMTYDEAREYTKPTIDLINEEAKKIAKKYGVRPQLVSFEGLMR